jgi:hypothetical protein
MGSTHEFEPAVLGGCVVQTHPHRDDISTRHRPIGLIVVPTCAMIRAGFFHEQLDIQQV